ncbi:MAG: hypothetical protein JST09_04110 [Bacteroidetes bacterium]|nr:hypothetical protein [Bacteroidota bacterium]
MKRFLLLFPFVGFFAFSSCKKAIENQLDDLIIKSMCDGQWIVTSFKNNGTDITSDFSGYKFQYHTNKKVDAIKNGTIEITGDWDGNALQKTTWADFPGNSLPVTLLNGNWKISNNTWTYVVASQTNGSQTKSFRIEKQ